MSYIIKREMTLFHKIIMYVVFICILGYGYYQYIYLGEKEHFVIPGLGGGDNNEQVKENTSNIKILKDTHESISKLMKTLSKTIIGLNEDTISEFEENGKLLLDSKWLNTNKKNIKMAILQYLTDKDLSEEKTDTKFPLKNQNIQLINFIFVENKFDDVYKSLDKTSISNSIIVMDTEISDMFDVSVKNEKISKRLYDKLKHKNENFFIEKISKFAKRYIKVDSKDKASLNEDVEKYWLIIFPNDKIYTKGSLKKMVMKKVGFFIQLINDEDNDNYDE